MANIYDINGNVLLGEQNEFNENLTMRYAFDDVSNTNYTVYRINKNRVDGTQQFAFGRCLGTETQGSLYKTPYDLAVSEGWFLVANGGIGSGLMIENSTVINDSTLPQLVGIVPLSIDQNGDLGYLDSDYIGKGQTYINQGVVSAMCGFYPIIDNYEDFDFYVGPDFETNPVVPAQRQIIGQFGNGDYMLLTSEGRNFDNSIGLTMTDAQRICKTLGVKFAYNLDGGGSTQIVQGRRIVNTIYQGTTGRRRGTFIVFNGKNTFSIPNA